jgi:2-dehydro-3-deoxyphosphogluconate aldolase/(4S)-4-hydroxy-2-oxoglutarate aldolase
MNDRMALVQQIKQAGIIVVVRASADTHLDRAIRTLRDEGLTVFEITLTTPGALAHIQSLRSSAPDCVVGAGTVLDPETAKAALAVGAQFIVSPVFDRRVIEEAHRHSAVAVPGTFTPTEALCAWEAGADIVKVFPASVVGPEYIKAMRGPLPQIRLMPTGGVNLDNALAFLEAGSFVLSVGTSLLDDGALRRGEFASAARKASALRSIVEAFAQRENR